MNISPQLHFDRQLIISLTSFPPRIKTVHQTIQSLLNQTKKADMVILWLADSEFPGKEKDLPPELLYLTQKGLSIEWCENLSSFKKLIPTLKKYPDALICTMDDDVLYDRNLLENLYNAYKKRPDVIHSGRVRRICFKKHQISPYNNWPFVTNVFTPSHLNFFTGVGGVLYPPNCLHKDVFREDIFMKFIPGGDDMWFNIMAIRNDCKRRLVGSNRIIPDTIKGTQECSLWENHNMAGIKNDERLEYYQSIFPELYDILRKAYKKEGAVRLFGFLPLIHIKHETDRTIYRLLGLITIWSRQLAPLGIICKLFGLFPISLKITRN